MLIFDIGISQLRISISEVNEKLTTQETVEVYIQLGNQVADMGNFEQAEKVFKTALAISERQEGKDSMAAGFALLELWDLYDRQGRDEEARQAWERMSKILKWYFLSLAADWN